MGRGKVILYPQVQKKLEDLGHRIKLARLRRKLTIEMVAERAKISRFSVREVEKGSPSVAIGIYVNVLMAIGMVKEPVVTVLPTDEPETMPQSAEEMTATLAGPPEDQPARRFANEMKKFAMPVRSRNAPKMMNRTM